MRRSVIVVVLAAVCLVAVTTGAQGRTTAKCDSSNPLDFGVMSVLSGPAANIGRLNMRGISLATKEVNAAGGVLGRCLKANVKDDGGNPTQAAQVVRQLIDQDGVKFIIGPVISGSNAVAAPIINSAKVIQIDENSLAVTSDPSNFPYTFKREINTNQQASALTAVVTANKWKSVAILTNNNPLGLVLAPGIQRLAESAGIRVTKIVYVAAGTPDMTPQIADLKSTDPEAFLMLVNSDPDQTAALKARLSLGWNVPVVGFPTVANPGTVNNFTRAQLNNVYAGQIWRQLTYASTKVGEGAPTGLLARKFVSAYARSLKAHNLKDSVIIPSGGYTSVQILAWAINGAKSTDPDVIKRYMETHRFTGVRGTYLWTPTDHTGVTLSMLTYGYANSLNAYGILRRPPEA